MQKVFFENLSLISRIAPPLFFMMFFVSLFKTHYRENFAKLLGQQGFALPVIVAALSMLPGCGIATMVTLLYLEGFIRKGVLIASFLASSDEALYVFLLLGFFPYKLFLLKFFLAVAVGLFIDLLSELPRSKTPRSLFHNGNCCESPQRRALFHLFLHTFNHWIRTTAFILTSLIILDLACNYFGIERIQSLFRQNVLLQPTFAAMFGLIPSCASSVFLATLYHKGALSLGGALAGLSAVSGEATLVLISGGVGFKDFVSIITVILTVSIFAGTAANFLV